MTHPAFISDALDDLAEVGDPWAPEPKPAPAAPGPNEPRYTSPIRAAVRSFARLQGIGDPAMVGAQGLDIGFLCACHGAAPDLFEELVSWRLSAEIFPPAHKAVPGARNKLRCDLHRDGVI